LHKCFIKWDNSRLSSEGDTRLSEVELKQINGEGHAFWPLSSDRVVVAKPPPMSVKSGAVSPTFTAACGTPREARQRTSARREPYPKCNQDEFDTGRGLGCTSCGH